MLLIRGSSWGVLGALGGHGVRLSVLEAGFLAQSFQMCKCCTQIAVRFFPQGSCRMLLEAGSHMLQGVRALLGIFDPLSGTGGAE